MRLEIGSRLGNYELTDKIGAGGMGVVFRARDSRLDRPVAIKLLSESICDVSSRERFESEVRIVTSLRHPHILTVIDFGEVEGHLYLVTELVEGGTLREWLAAERRTWHQVISILVGVADGLATAHRSGILHRDLKPENVLIDGSRYARLADFGLAKRFGVAEASGVDEKAPTVSLERALTEPGSIIGTLAYMSPEQTSGGALDDRSDVFSFGILLYEGLSGRQPFEGSGDLELLAAIRERAPAPLPAEIPEKLRWIVEKALEKDPAERYQDMRDLVVDLRRALRLREDRPVERAVDAGAEVGAGSWRARNRRWLLAVALLLAGVALLAGQLIIERSSPPILAVAHERRLTDRIGMEVTPAVSPDGRAVAFASPVDGKQQIFVRLLSKGAPIPLTDDDVDHHFPRWVDESTLIYLVSADSGDSPGTLWETFFPPSTSPRRIGAAEGEVDVCSATRKIAMFRKGPDGASLVIRELSGEKRESAWRLPEGTYRSPRWAPDGRHLAFEVQLGFVTSEIRVLDTLDGDTRTIVKAPRIQGLAWLPDGSGLVYSSSDGSTLVYPPTFGLRVKRLGDAESSPLPLVSGGYASYVEPDIGPRGHLVASRVHMESDIFAFPVSGAPRENMAGARRITNQTGQVQVPSLSPDGQEIAYLSDSGGHANVWVARVDGTRSPRQITFELDPQTVIAIPRWSPRRDLIVYFKHSVGDGDGQGEQWLIHSDGSEPRKLVDSAGGAHWSPDGEWLYYISNRKTPSGSMCTERIHVDTGEVFPVRCGAASIQVTSDGITGYFSPSVERQGEVHRVSPVDTGVPELLVGGLQHRIPLWPHHYDLSPDDRLLATPLKDRGTTDLWVISTRDASLRQITDFAPRATLITRQTSWSSDSQQIYAAVLETDADIVILEGALP